jgi:hypothetical protein
LGPYDKRTEHIKTHLVADSLSFTDDIWDDDWLCPAYDATPAYGIAIRHHHETASNHTVALSIENRRTIIVTPETYRKSVGLKLSFLEPDTTDRPMWPQSPLFHDDLKITLNIQDGEGIIHSGGTSSGGGSRCSNEHANKVSKVLQSKFLSHPKMDLTSRHHYVVCHKVHRTPLFVMHAIERDRFHFMYDANVLRSVDVSQIVFGVLCGGGEKC